MFGIGETELVLIVLFAFLVFGPDKLPGMGRTLGRALRQFKSAQEGFTEVVQTNIVDPAAEALSDNPKKPNRKRAAELDEDADIETGEGEQVERERRTETFAERKKRLAAEKAAREEAEKQAAEAAEADAASADSDTDTDVAEGDSAKPEPEGAHEPEPESPAPSKPSAADLYSMKRPSRETSAAVGGDNPVASHEVSLAPKGAAPRADGVRPADSGAPTDESKEA